MKKRYLIMYFTLVLVAILLIVFLFNFTAKTWNIQTVDYVGVQTGDYSGFTSLFMDSSGNPHICYRSWDWDAKNFSLKYATLNGSDWRIQQVDVGNIIDSSMVLDTDDVPHIVYYDYENKVTKVASLSASNWTVQVINPAFSSGIISNVVFGSDGDFRFCYYNQNTQNIEYVESKNGNWSTEIVSNTTGSYIPTSLALDSSNTPHILFLQRYSNGETYDVEYAKKADANWVTSKVDVNCSDLWTYQFIVDSKGSPFIALTRTSKELDLVRWSGSDWAVQKLDSPAYWTSPALDSQDNLQFAYDSDGGMRYISSVDSNRSPQKVEVNGSINNPSLALDTTGNPHISCNQVFRVGRGDYTYAVGYVTRDSPIELHTVLISVVGLALTTLMLIVSLVILIRIRY